MVKNAHYNYPEPQVMFPNHLFCPTNRLKPKESSGNQHMVDILNIHVLLTD